MVAIGLEILMVDILLNKLHKLLKDKHIWGYIVYV